jgi:hypothetical protein
VFTRAFSAAPSASSVVRSRQVSSSQIQNEWARRPTPDALGMGHPNVQCTALTSSTSHWTTRRGLPDGSRGPQGHDEARVRHHPRSARPGVARDRGGPAHAGGNRTADTSKKTTTRHPPHRSAPRHSGPQWSVAHLERLAHDRDWQRQMRVARRPRRALAPPEPLQSPNDRGNYWAVQGLNTIDAFRP